jgi:predicted phage tail protein
VNGATFTAPADVSITATASDADGTIQKVEFYSGTTLLGSSTTAPYSFAWTGVAAGSYTLKAIAYDNGGAQTSSSTVAITVSAANQPPSVALTSPADGAAFTAPATVAIAATASDADGIVQQVDFYSGNTLLGSATAAPYSFTWNNVSAGTYTLKAIAIDNSGAQTSSATVSITVNAAPPPPSYTLAFTASPDHDTNVTSYLLEIFANGADPNTAQAVASTDLGKPTPDANRDIQVDETSFLSALAPGTYLVSVSAIGPGGQTRGAPYTFTR